MLFGVSKVITQYIKKGQHYSKIKKVHSINIVYFNLVEGDNYVYHGRTNFVRLHTGDELQLTPAQRKEFGMLNAGGLFPEYYILEVNRFNDMAKDTLNEWIYYLRHEKIEAHSKAQGLVQARELLDYDKLSDADKRSYDNALSNRLDDDAHIYTTKMEGRAEGAAFGIEKALKEMALNALRDDLPMRKFSASPA
jgi:hypothetical protein